MTYTITQKLSTVDSERGTPRRRDSSSAAAGRPGPVPTGGKAGSIQREDSGFEMNLVTYYSILPTIAYIETNIHTHRHGCTDRAPVMYNRQTKVKFFHMDAPPLGTLWLFRHLLHTTHIFYTVLTFNFLQKFHQRSDKNIANISGLFQPEIYYTLIHYVHVIVRTFTLTFLSGSEISYNYSLQDSSDQIPQLDGQDDPSSSISSSSGWKKGRRQKGLQQTC